MGQGGEKTRALFSGHPRKKGRDKEISPLGAMMTPGASGFSLLMTWVSLTAASLLGEKWLCLRGGQRGLGPQGPWDRTGFATLQLHPQGCFHPKSHFPGVYHKVM